MALHEVRYSLTKKNFDKLKKSLENKGFTIIDNRRDGLNPEYKVFDGSLEVYTEKKWWGNCYHFANLYPKKAQVWRSELEEGHPTEKDLKLLKIIEREYRWNHPYILHL